MILVTSGATEIGRLDYLQRTGHELTGVTEQDKWITPRRARPS